MDFVDDYDIVHISNAIDHSQNPQAVFNKMICACKNSGYVVVQGLVDEAVHEGFEGFHQWNFSMAPHGLVSYSDKNNNIVHFPDGQILAVLKNLPHANRDWFISVWKANHLKLALLKD